MGVRFVSIGMCCIYGMCCVFIEMCCVFMRMRCVYVGMCYVYANVLCTCDSALQVYLLTCVVLWDRCDAFCSSAMFSMKICRYQNAYCVRTALYNYNISLFVL